MAHIFIHAGYGKAGSTAIQGLLARNRDKLFARGVGALALALNSPVAGEDAFDTPAAFFGALSTREKGAASAKVAAILDHVGARCERVLWSCETLLHHPTLMGSVARELSPRHRLTFVIYLRNHADWLVSAYMQWAIKHKQKPGRIPSFDAFIASRARELDYPAMIDAWRAAVTPASVLVRSYDQAGDVVADFADLCGVDRTDLSAPNAQDAYATPDYAVMAFLKLLHDQQPKPVLPNTILALLRDAGVTETDIHPVDPTPLPIDGDTLGRIAESYASQRALLRDRYGVSLNDTPRPNAFAPRPHTSDNNTDLIAILAMLTTRLGARVQKLEQELKTLRATREAP